MKQYQQVCVSGFILNKENKVLLVKRSDDDDFLPGLWELPGGGTDFGEHPLKALKRELQEEVGLEVEIGKPLYVDDYFMENRDEKKHRVEMFFLCIVKSLNVQLSREHAEYKWVSKENIKNIEMTEYMTKAVDECFKNL